MKLDETTPEEGVQSTSRATEGRGRHALPVGQLPTVSLLPREFLNQAYERRLRRIFVGAVAIAVIVAVGATGLAAQYSVMATDRASSAAATAQRLAAQLRSFQDVQKVQADIASGQAAVDVATSTEIDWQAQINAIEADMPDGYTVTGITADSAKAFADYPQGAGPLDRPRAATVQLTATTPTIEHLPGWLYRLRSIPAYADASPSVTNGDGGGYTVVVTVHLSPNALINAGKAAK